MLHRYKPKVHWKHYAIIFLQNTSQVKLLPFDHLLSVRILVVMLLNNRLFAMQCNVFTPTSKEIRTIIPKCRKTYCDFEFVPKF